MMNENIEQKLKDLMAEAGMHGDWPVRMVLHMLLGSYHTAQQKKFAQHCSQFSGIRFEMESQPSDHPDDLSELTERNNYYH